MSPDVDFKELRTIEKEIAHLDYLPEHVNFVAIYDRRGTVKTEAILGMITTVVVMLLLGISSWAFSANVSHLVIIPLENMISLVKSITNDPLKAAHDEEERALIEEIEE